MKLVNFEPERDFDLLYDFFSDTENLSKISFPVLIRNKQEFDSFLHDKLCSAWRDFKIMVSDSGASIGFFFSHSHGSNHCYISLGIFSPYQSSGYGAIFSALVLNYIFTLYPYERVFENVFEFNNASMDLHKACGIAKEVGVLPRVRFYKNDYFDMHIFTVSRDAFLTSPIATKFVR